jgi:hypothetical protein
VRRIEVNGTATATWRLGGQLGDLEGLTALEAVVLPNNGLVGGLPGSWGGLPRLAEVDVSQNSLAGGVPAGWGAGEALLRRVRLSQNPALGVSGGGALESGPDFLAQAR